MGAIETLILSRSTIKPSSPTPRHLQTFELPFFGQLLPPFYSEIIFFYTPTTKNSADMSDTLKDSLSKTLTVFYPLAGRLKDACSIDCNDKGAYFLEARVNCQISEVLREPDAKLLGGFLPVEPRMSELSAGCMLLVQQTTFDCGGIAIGMCFQHKMFDLSSMCCFFQNWTTMATGNSEAVVCPKFIDASFMPPRDNFVTPTMGYATTANYTTRRFVFEASNIAVLKEKTAGENGMNHPTRVQAVSAFILKHTIAAARSKSGSETPTVYLQTVDLRRWVDPPLPKNSIAHFVWTYPVIIEESAIELSELVGKIKERFTEFCTKKANRFKGDAAFQVIHESLEEYSELFKSPTISCTSWCRFPLYEMDFGWGKPTWVSSPVNQFGNLILLVDTKCGNGIEAWVTLDEEEMAILEHDEELLKVASFNPSPLEEQ